MCGSEVPLLEVVFHAQAQRGRRRRRTEGAVLGKEILSYDGFFYGKHDDLMEKFRIQKSLIYEKGRF